MAKKHKTLSYEQILCATPQDREVPFDEGLDFLAREGWELVTSFPSKGYAPGCTTLFVFRAREGK